MRDTTPDTTASDSPPTGCPTTMTVSWRRGRGPNSRGSTPVQKAGSSTVNSAMSHSAPIASTRAKNLASSPRRLTRTWDAYSTECALVRSQRSPGADDATMKPDEVDANWRLRCQGREKLGSVWTQ